MSTPSITPISVRPSFACLQIPRGIQTCPLQLSRTSFARLSTMTRSSLPTVNVLFLAIVYLFFLVCVPAQSGFSSSQIVSLTKRTARVRVINQSGKYIEPGSIRVVHKYSDVYKEFLQFQKGLKNGEMDDFGGKHRVTYHTGLFPSGKDWWYISFVFADEAAIYETTPNNFRCIIDELEKVAPIVLSYVAGEVAGELACGLPPLADCTAAHAAAFAAGLVADSFSRAVFNAEGTCGFKQCILREEDSVSKGAWVTIYIKANGVLTIDVSSGAASTVYSLLRVLPDGGIVSQSDGATLGSSDFQTGESL